MEKYYDVVFYGQIHDGKDFSQVKQLLVKIIGKSESELEHLFSGNKFSLKKCSSYNHAKKYADLFEKAGAKVNIEQIGKDKPVELEQVLTEEKLVEEVLAEEVLAETKPKLSNTQEKLLGTGTVIYLRFFGLILPIICTIAGIYWLVKFSTILTNGYYYTSNPIGFISGMGLILSGIVSGLFLYGFADLVENIAYIRRAISLNDNSSIEKS